MESIIFVRYLFGNYVSRLVLHLIPVLQASYIRKLMSEMYHDHQSPLVVAEHFYCYNLSTNITYIFQW